MNAENKKILENMTLEQKCSYFLGNRFWQFRKFNNYPLITVSDGPNGIRKMDPIVSMDGNNLPATSYPSSCLTACSFDKELLELEGKMIAKEAIHKNINIVLGPGINIKRSPLCGRNFEYFSEDPFLTSELAISYINGMQSLDVGTSLKHFAANSQESYRMVNDSLVDERALYEIYLKAFERVIKKSSPTSVMVSYNKLNGVHTCESSYLITDILRNKWGYDGLAISDWGGVFDPVQSFKAGLNIEMPGTCKWNDYLIKEYLESNDSTIEDKTKIDESMRRIIETYEKVVKEKEDNFDMEEAYLASRKIASESMVLLQNKGALPIKREERIALIGAFGEKPRFQGGGSSNVVPSFNDTFIQIMNENMIDVSYAEGYSLNNEKSDDFLEETALNCLTNKDKVIFFMGLPQFKESEGFDRKDMSLPTNQLKLLDKIAERTNNIVVVLQLGSPVELPFLDKVNAVLLTYLTGEMNGSSTFDVLYGEINPSGRLAETFPLKKEDSPCNPYYLQDKYFSEYRESIFVGYRYYSTFNVPVRYPFGYGLSYTNFTYSSPSIKEEKDKVIIEVNVKNEGDVFGKEVVQVYVGVESSLVLRPKKELKGFTKVVLLPNEEKLVRIEIEKEDLKYYSVSIHDFVLEEGKYNFYISKNVNEDIFIISLNIDGQKVEEKLYPKIYNSMERPISREEFELVYGRKIDTTHNVKPYNMDTTLGELRKTFIGRIAFGFAEKITVNKTPDGMKDMVKRSFNMTPIRSTSMRDVGFSRENIRGIIDIFAGHIFRGLRKLLRKTPYKKKDKKKDENK